MKRFLTLSVIFIVIIMKPAAAQTYKAWVNEGDKALSTSRYAEAIEYYGKAMEFETGDVALNFKIAEACRLYKDYNNAAKWYLKTVMEDKTGAFPLALFYLAEMKKYLGQYDESKTLYDRYVAQHPADSTYFTEKAKKESSFNENAKQIAGNTNTTSVKNIGSPVNTIYSDFGARIMGDSVLYYSSLRFKYEPKNKKSDPYYVSRILKSTIKNDKPSTPVPISIMFNDAPTHNCNVAFSPDYHLMVFSRCSSGIDYSLDCELYYSLNTNGTWGKPVKIAGAVNLENYTSTQPSIEARGADGYTLYFVSDRPGGIGKLDIWKSDISSNYEFGNPVNLGEPINTFDDETTPFFDTPRQILYFSSYGLPGMGGLDIFKSVKSPAGFGTPENLGPPFNSSVNDVYFTVNRDTLSGTLSSNRPTSMNISNQTCCYDIYIYHTPIPPPPATVDTTSKIIAGNNNSGIGSGNGSDTRTGSQGIDLSNPSSYADFLPLNLYFENDEPDRKTTATSTTRDYAKIYQEYIAHISEYKSQFSSGQNTNEAKSSELLIDNFFTNTVIASYNKLEHFSSLLLDALKQGNKITLEVRGRTSPLAKTDYNINLSKRRISSLLNYLKKYDNGALLSFINNHSLNIKEIPAGESLVEKGISDNLADKRNSVYNPAAAMERRIEIINITIQKPDEKK